MTSFLIKYEGCVKMDISSFLKKRSTLSVKKVNPFCEKGQSFLKKQSTILKKQSTIFENQSTVLIRTVDPFCGQSKF